MNIRPHLNCNSSYVSGLTQWQWRIGLYFCTFEWFDFTNVTVSFMGITISNLPILAQLVQPGWANSIADHVSVCLCVCARACYNELGLRIFCAEPLPPTIPQTFAPNNSPTAPQSPRTFAPTLQSSVTAYGLLSWKSHTLNINNSSEIWPRESWPKADIF